MPKMGLARLRVKSKLRTVLIRHLATALSHSYPSASADSSALLLLQLPAVSPNLFFSGTMSGFAFVVVYDDTLTPTQNASRRGPDYLVRVPNDHLLLGIGSAYFLPPTKMVRPPRRLVRRQWSRLSRIA